MKILVIGSKGFIGSHCMDFFLKSQPVSDGYLPEKQGGVRAGNEVFGCDVIDSAEKKYFRIQSSIDFDKIFTAEKFDLCINASGSADVGFSFKHPDSDFELNFSNVEKILNAIQKHNPSCRLINFSSAAVYGNPKSLPVSETAETNPLSPYGKHKLQSEQLLKRYWVEHSMRTCSIRVFSAYGPGLRKQLFWDIFQKSKQGAIVKLFGTGKESRDFIFIEDLASAVDCVAKNTDFKGEAINVSSGIETPIEKAATTLLKQLGNDFQLAFTGEEKQGDPKNWKADITQLSRMGFKPFHTFEQGILKLTDWLKKEK